MTDHRLYAPATVRNREPILEVLRQCLPARGLVLEIASGTGEHAAHFAASLPDLTFQPSDLDPDNLRSIQAWGEAGGLSNMRAAFVLDVSRSPWPLEAADAVLCINMIHIAPWEMTPFLMKGAASLLAQNAPLYLYGPFKMGGHHTAPTNVEFDMRLKQSDPSWGIRNLEDVVEQAQQAGFGEPLVTPMPANNLSVIFRRL